MRIIGLDLGEKRIGVSISDESETIARGLKVIYRENKKTDLIKLKEVINSFGVTEIIFGLPKNMNGTFGPQADKAIELANEISEGLNISVKSWDERLTTVMAEKALIEGGVRRKKRKQLVDNIAATLILQNYLDFKKKGRV